MALTDAEKMQVYRARKKQGMRVWSFEFSEEDLRTLLGGMLTVNQFDDEKAVRKALQHFLTLCQIEEPPQERTP